MSKLDVGMNANQYRVALKKLGFSQSSAARFLGINARTSRYWACVSVDAKIPKAVTLLLRAMIKFKIKPEDLA